MLVEVCCTEKQSHFVTSTHSRSSLLLTNFLTVNLKSQEICLGIGILRWSRLGDRLLLFPVLKPQFKPGVN